MVLVLLLVAYVAALEAARALVLLLAILQGVSRPRRSPVRPLKGGESDFGGGGRSRGGSPGPRRPQEAAAAEQQGGGGGGGGGGYRAAYGAPPQPPPGGWVPMG